VEPKPAVSVNACWDALRALQGRVEAMERSCAMFQITFDDVVGLQKRVKALEKWALLDGPPKGEGTHG